MGLQICQVLVQGSILDIRERSGGPAGFAWRLDVLALSRTSSVDLRYGTRKPYGLQSTTTFNRVDDPFEDTPPSLFRSFAASFARSSISAPGSMQPANYAPVDLLRIYLMIVRPHHRCESCAKAIYHLHHAHAIGANYLRKRSRSALRYVLASHCYFSNMWKSFPPTEVSQDYCCTRSILSRLERP